MNGRLLSPGRGFSAPLLLLADLDLEMTEGSPGCPHVAVSLAPGGGLARPPSFSGRLLCV